jgi:hypothetical protein
VRCFASLTFPARFGLTRCIHPFFVVYLAPEGGVLVGFWRESAASDALSIHTKFVSSSNPYFPLQTPVLDGYFLELQRTV